MPAAAVKEPEAEISWKCVQRRKLPEVKSTPRGKNRFFGFLGIVGFLGKRHPSFVLLCVFAFSFFEVGGCFGIFHSQCSILNDRLRVGMFGDSWGLSVFL